jgi:hypothetical protein
MTDLINNVAILCAGPGLGFYIPGLVMNYQLNQKGLNSTCFVFESLLIKDKQQNAVKAKEKFHKSFSYALAGQSLAKDPSPYLDPNELISLFQKWESGNINQFILLSGFWVPVIEKYLYKVNTSKVSVICCHLDSADSTSWSLFKSIGFEHQHVWFLNWEKDEICFHLNYDHSDAIPFFKREHRLIIHGGGWGIGTYMEKIDALNRTNFSLDVIAYQMDDLFQTNDQNDYFLIDPDWKSWQTDFNGSYHFPPFSFYNNGKVDFQYTEDCPEVYKLIKKNKAIISKPGAGTLIDSLSSSTPLIYLEPFGDYERKNALLWEKHGLGISYEQWKALNFSETILKDINENLTQMKTKTKNFINYLIKDLHGTQNQ